MLCFPQNSTTPSADFPAMNNTLSVLSADPSESRSLMSTLSHIDSTLVVSNFKDPLTVDAANSATTQLPSSTFRSPLHSAPSISPTQPQFPSDIQVEPQKTSISSRRAYSDPAITSQPPTPLICARTSSESPTAHHLPIGLQFTSSLLQDSPSDDDDNEFLCDLHSSEFPPSIPLVPFDNQIGGHAAFLRFSAKVVCKPAHAVEKHFYETMDTSDHLKLKPFIPVYLGCVDVRYPTIQKQFRDHRKATEINQRPEWVLGQHSSPHAMMDTWLTASVAGVSDHMRKRLIRDALSPRAHRLRQIEYQESMKRLQVSTTPPPPPPPQPLPISPFKLPVPSIEDSFTLFSMEGFDDGVTRSDMTSSEVNTQPLPHPASFSPTTTTNQLPDSPIHEASPLNINPWSLHCYANQYISNQQKHSLAFDNNGIHQFLLMEDLTEGLKLPCVLDLKMGTRQHGIATAPEKKLRQMKKVFMSTSASLGLRLCGMQVYNTITNNYTYRDKYHGRHLRTSEELQLSLLEFLHNGERILVELCPSILTQLYQLRLALETLDGYRFFASSLLLLYDACDPSKGLTLRMVDFARCIVRTDRGELLSQILQSNARMSPSKDPPSTTSPTSNSFNSDDLDRMLLEEEEDTFRGYDHGYMRGVDYLINLFEGILKESGGVASPLQTPSQARSV